MRVIIIENELYLAQSIAARLSEFHFETEIYSSVKEAMDTQGDVYLLSTNLPGQNFLPLIKKHRDKNILLMVNYINNDTVGEPLRAGARDYIVKPFMIEELIRKIEHYHNHRVLQERIKFYEEYLNNLYKGIELPIEPISLTLPIVIRTNYQRVADKLALELSKLDRNTLCFISLDEEGWEKRVQEINREKIGYIIHLEKLKKGEREKLYSLLKGKEFILTDSSSEVDVPFPILELNSSKKLYDQEEILTIDEYVQYIVRAFQYKFPDTELSKKLGISRKSLWEKRKKYGLFKKK